MGCAMMASLQQLRRRWLSHGLRFPAATHHHVNQLVSAIHGSTSRCACAHGGGDSRMLSRLMLVDAAARVGARDAAAADSFLRTVNVTPVSSRILDNLGVWSRLRVKHAVYRMAIRHEDDVRRASEDATTSTGRRRSFFLGHVLGHARPSSSALLEFTQMQSPLGFICGNEDVHRALLDVVDAEAVSSRQGRYGHDVLLFGSALARAHVEQAAEAGGSEVPWGYAELVSPCPDTRPAVAHSPRETQQSHTSNPHDGIKCSRRSSNDDDTKAVHRESMDAEVHSTVRFGLLLSCEGRDSAVRRTLESPVLQHDYGQTAFVCTAHVAKVDDGNVCAFQNFFRDGTIVGMLPLSADAVNIIYSTSPSQARELLECGETELVDRLNRRLHAYAPSDIPRITRLSPASSRSPMRGSFPLSLHVATRVCGPRVMLLGDAAHAIHPFAGQGFNLGLYDVCALTSILERAMQSGQAMGGAGASLLSGAEFAGSMLRHTAPMIAGMEAIKQVLSSMPRLGVCGMRVLNSTPLLSDVCKSRIMHFASGASFAARHADSFLLR